MTPVSLLLVVTFVAADAPASNEWKVVGGGNGVTVYQRQHGASDLQETLGVGVVDAAPIVVKRALDDYDAKDGAMPYLKEMRVLKRDERGALIYHRTAPPLVADRDYSIRFWDETITRADGVMYVCRWRTANDEGPAPKDGVVRVDVTEGYWQLEPIDGGAKTRTTYFAFATPGGDIPSGIASWGTSLVLGDIFTALRTRVKNPKYAKAP